MRLPPAAAALLNLPKDACHWPLDGPTRWWCGRPAECGAYCKAHHLQSRDPEIVPLSDWSIMSLLRLRRPTRFMPRRF